jgi:AcrR family transcriptional regulator
MEGPGTSQRSRILAAALDLIATHGVDGMTMRQLAAACDLNIATLYHYVGSKSELLTAIVAERRYDQGLRHVDLAVDPTLPPGPRLAQFFTHLACSALGELRIWRLLVGEGLRNDPVARAEAGRMSAALEGAVGRWLGELFPELSNDRRRAVTSVVTGQLLAAFFEELLLGPSPVDRIAIRGEATAAAVFPTST